MNYGKKFKYKNWDSMGRKGRPLTSEISSEIELKGQSIKNSIRYA